MVLEGILAPILLLLYMYIFIFFIFFYLTFLYRCTNQICNLVSLCCPVILHQLTLLGSITYLTITHYIYKKGWYEMNDELYFRIHIQYIHLL